MTSPDSTVDRLCLACGLCCDGTLFRDVELQPGDDKARLTALGLPLEQLKTKTRFPQPCSALCADQRCRLYPERPSRCREFECSLLKAAQAGDVEIPAALRTIRETRQRAEKVRRLLRALGDTDESLALTRRFKRTSRRLQTAAPDLSDDEAETFAELTLAVHDLNLRLGRSFYT